MFKTLLRQIGDYKKDAILTPVFVVLEVIMEVIIPIMMAAIIDYGLADQSIGKVVAIGLAIIGAAMLALWFGVESGRTASSASSGSAGRSGRSVRAGRRGRPWPACRPTGASRTWRTASVSWGCCGTWAAPLPRTPMRRASSSSIPAPSGRTRKKRCSAWWASWSTPRRKIRISCSASAAAWPSRRR